MVRIQTQGKQFPQQHGEHVTDHHSAETYAPQDVNPYAQPADINTRALENDAPYGNAAYAAGGAGVVAENPYGGSRANGAYEMQNMPQVEDMQGFFARIDDIRQAIRQFDENISHIEGLHARSLNEIGDEQSQFNHRELEKASTDTRQLQNNIRDTIKKLENANGQMQAGPDNRTRVTQTNNVKKKMLESIKKFQRVEVEYKNKYRAQQKRQVELTNPGMSAQEIDNVIDSDQGQQVFAEATLRSNRHGEAKSALREVQERHQDIKKIERTIAELAQLFAEMNVMMEEQAPAVEAIQERAEATRNDMEGGNANVDKAIVSARSARRKKWICFWICVLILIAIALAVGLGVGLKRN